MKTYFLILILIIIAAACSSQDKKEQDVKLYFIALNGSSISGERIESNDILVEVTKNVSYDKHPIEGAINELINTKDNDEILNFIKGPELILVKVNIAGGVADIYLQGNFAISSLSDIYRISAQLHSTVKQFTEFNKINFYINNQTLDSYLNQEKKGF